MTNKLLKSVRSVLVLLSCLMTLGLSAQNRQINGTVVDTQGQPVIGASVFVVGKHEYIPFPEDFRTANPNLHNVLGWASAE